MIAHNAEQHCDFGSALLHEESHITTSLGTTELQYYTYWFLESRSGI